MSDRRIAADVSRGGTGWYIGPAGERVLELARDLNWRAVVVPLESTYFRGTGPRFQAFSVDGSGIISRLTGVATWGMATRAAVRKVAA